MACRPYRSPPGITWNRDSHWQIRDRLEGEGEHLVEVFFHFAPGIAEILPDGEGVTMRRIKAFMRCSNKSKEDDSTWNSRGWRYAG